MIQPDGSYSMLSATTLPDAERELAMNIAELKAARGTILAHGTEADIAAIAARVRLGDRELRNRAERRKMQRESRRQNR